MEKKIPEKIEYKTFEAKMKYDDGQNKPRKMHRDIQQKRKGVFQCMAEVKGARHHGYDELDDKCGAKFESFEALRKHWRINHGKKNEEVQEHKPQKKLDGTILG